MKDPIALNGLMLYVTDVQASLDVYQTLGFQVVRAHAPVFASVRLGDVLIQFQDKRNPSDPSFRAEAMAEPKGGGLFIYLQVEDVDQFYKDIQEQGVVPTTVPRDWPGGNREFVVRDPDGYKLVFYQAGGVKKHDE
jgi:catechol 2,3-dioxygenase-like lactoylglutathione lyase family enzyme